MTIGRLSLLPAVSAILLGLAVMSELRPPLAAAVALVGSWIAAIGLLLLGWGFRPGA